MKLNLELRNAGVILLALNCVLVCTAQIAHGGAGGWGGAAGSPGSPGAPGSSDFGYGYGGADSRGRAYGGAGGNGGYYAGGIDDEGRRYQYSGGVGAPGVYQGGIPGSPNAYPNYYDPRYRSSANAKFTQMNWLWVLLPVAVFMRFL